MADAQFKQRIEDALENKTLRGALGRFVDTYSDARAKAYEGYDVDALRDKIADVKSYAATHLDEMIDKFEKAATARGAKVYRAKTGKMPDSIFSNWPKSKMSTILLNLNRWLQRKFTLIKP